MKGKEDSEKPAIKLNIQKTKIMTSGPSVQFSSVAQSCPTLWDPMNRSTPGLPVHQRLELWHGFGDTNDDGEARKLS